MHPLNKIKIKWSPKFAYVIGLIATDGCLSKDGRHIAFISKDLRLIRTFKKCLGLENKISKKKSGFIAGKYVHWVQFGDVVFYRFLMSIGLTPAKSKILSTLKIPNKYFFDFLRGSIDGDGCFYSYWDPRWRSSYMFYTCFSSASKKHLEWIREKLSGSLSINGHITNSKSKTFYQLKYAKRESLVLLKKIYNLKGFAYLERKYLKINKALSIIGIKI